MDTDTPDLLVTNLRSPNANDYALLQELNRRSLSIPVIHITSFEDMDHQQIEDRDNLTILEQPVAVETLCEVLTKKLFEDAGSSDDPFYLTDYLQLAAMGRRSLWVKVEMVSGATGMIWVVRGEVWDARLEELQSEEALIKILSEPIFYFKYYALQEIPGIQRINKTLNGLLLEAAKAEDEKANATAKLLASASALPQTDKNPVAEESAEEELPPAEPGLESTMLSIDQEMEEMVMNRITQLCKVIVEDVSDAIACGIIDLNTGLVLGAHHNVPYFTQTYLDAVAGACVDLFRGKMVKRIETLIGKQRGRPVRNAFREVFIEAETVYHFMKVIPEKDAVAVLVTKKTTNQGWGWASLRSNIGELTDTLKFGSNVVSEA